MTKHEVTRPTLRGTAGWRQGVLDSLTALGNTSASGPAIVGALLNGTISPRGPETEQNEDVPVIKVTMSGVTPEAVKAAVEATLQDERRPSEATFVFSQDLPGAKPSPGVHYRQRFRQVAAGKLDADVAASDLSNEISALVEWARHAGPVRVPRPGTPPGHTCEVPGDTAEDIENVAYDLRCAGCVATRIAIDGPMLPVNEQDAVSGGSRTHSSLSRGHHMSESRPALVEPSSAPEQGTSYRCCAKGCEAPVRVDGDACVDHLIDLSVEIDRAQRSPPKDQCRLCFETERFAVWDIDKERWLPGYCDRHGDALCVPLTTPVEEDRTNSPPPRETCDCGACAICQSMRTGPELVAELASDRSSDPIPQKGGNDGNDR